MNIWTGGKNPAGRKYVTVKFRDHRIKTVPAHQLDWLHDPRDERNDVVSWILETDLKKVEQKEAA